MASEFEGDTVALATRVMYELLGRRWVPVTTTTEFHETHSNQRVVILDGRPVQDVEYVRLEGTEDDLTFTLESGYRLRLGTPINHIYQGRYGIYGPGERPCSQPRIEVRYTYGSEAPLGIKRAIEVLASEIHKGMIGDGTCRLPQRVTSITRQGMTMSVLDSQEYLDEGKTGIPEVDSALRTFNPSQAKRPARVFGRVNPPPARTGTIQP